MIQITYHGHACYSIMDPTYHLLIDPYLSENPLAVISPEDLDPTHILVSHGHNDHLGDALPIAKRTKALIIATNELAIYCKNKGANVHGMNIGGSYAFPFGKVKLTPAWHSSSFLEDGKFIYTGDPGGFLIQIGGKNIYHAGDTGIFGDMKLIGDSVPLDCALLPIGDNYVMGPDDAVLAAQMLQAKLTIPMHYNTFPLIRQDPALFIRKLEAVSLAGKVLKPEETITLA